MNYYKTSNISLGPFFRNSHGQRIKASDLESAFLDRLDRVKALQPDLISVSDDVSEEYGVSRPF